MSYFIVISGAGAGSLSVPVGHLVALSDAQPYLSTLSSRIAQLDGSPSFHWDDGSTGTSHELVPEPHEHSILATLADTIETCANNQLVFRMWWANDKPDACLIVPTVRGAAAALEMFERQQSGRFPGVGLVMQPN